VVVGHDPERRGGPGAELVTKGRTTVLRIVLAVVAAVALAAGTGCSGKSSDSPGVPAKKNSDPKAPGLMRPPAESGPGLPKYIERKRG